MSYGGIFESFCKARDNTDVGRLNVENARGTTAIQPIEGGARGVYVVLIRVNPEPAKGGNL